MVIRQGEVYWLDLGEPEGSRPGFRRPFVVVQNNVYNRGNIRTAVVCAVTGNPRRMLSPGNVLLEVGEANLKLESVVVVSQLYTVNKSDLDERIGTLSMIRVRQILDGVKLVLEPREVPA